MKEMKKKEQGKRRGHLAAFLCSTDCPFVTQKDKGEGGGEGRKGS